MLTNKQRCSAFYFACHDKILTFLLTFCSRITSFHICSNYFSFAGGSPSGAVAFFVMDYADYDHDLTITLLYIFARMRPVFVYSNANYICCETHSPGALAV